MGIQKDAGELLVFVYNKKIAGERTPQINTLIETTGWERNRAENAVEYLIEENLVAGDIKKMINGSRRFSIRGVISGATKLIEEDKKKFKRTFTFEVGIPGLFKFSWGATER